MAGGVGWYLQFFESFSNDASVRNGSGLFGWDLM